MTQERYQEAAELQDGLVKDYKSLGMHEHRAACELAAEVLTKLASGWVLVPGNAIAEVRNNNLYWLVDDSYEVTDGPLYAAAPKP